MFRKKARSWLSAIDKQLRVATSEGLSQFQQPEDIASRAEPRLWPCLTLAIDQGSDGWAASMYLLRKQNLNILLQFDPSHRAWNDAQAGLQKAKLWGSVLLLQLTMNLDHGPWSNARWHSSIKEAANVFSSMENPHRCCLLQSLIEPILQDTGDIESFADTDLAQTVCSTLPEHFATLHPKVSMTRWFGFVDTAHRFLQTWHRRLLLQLYLCIQTGVFSGAHAQKMLERIQVTELAEENTEKVSTSRESDDVRELRLACKNTLELATMVLGDTHLYSLCRVICYALEPLRCYQTLQSKALRACDEVAGWYLCQAQGQGWANLCQTVRLLSASGPLSDLGVGRRSPELSTTELHMHHLDVINEDRVVQALGNLVVGVLGARLQTEAVYTRGLPYRLCALLSDEAAPRVVEELRAQLAAWEVVKRQRSAFWRKVVARSPFGLVFVQQVVETLRKAEWEVSPEVRDLVRSAFNSLGQTKVVEDGFQKERHAEVQRNSNRRMSLSRMWLTPVDAKVLTNTHRFKEIPFNEEVVDRGLRTADAKGFHYPTIKEASLRINDIATNSRTPP